MQLTDGPSSSFLWGFSPFFILSVLQARLMGRLLLYRELKVELNMTHEFMRRDDRYALNSMLVNTLWQKGTF